MYLCFWPRSIYLYLYIWIHTCTYIRMTHEAHTERTQMGPNREAEYHECTALAERSTTPRMHGATGGAILEHGPATMSNVARGVCWGEAHCLMASRGVHSFGRSTHHAQNTHVAAMAAGSARLSWSVGMQPWPHTWTRGCVLWGRGTLDHGERLAQGDPKGATLDAAWPKRRWLALAWNASSTRGTSAALEAASTSAWDDRAGAHHGHSSKRAMASHDARTPHATTRAPRCGARHGHGCRAHVW